MAQFNPECPHCTQSLPERTADTMSDAIAISSPDGRVSSRAKGKFLSELGQQLFGKYDPRIPHIPTNSERASALRQSAANMRDLASRGMQSKRMIRQAENLEAQAQALEGM